jgi:hypothetical protein
MTHTVTFMALDKYGRLGVTTQDLRVLGTGTVGTMVQDEAGNVACLNRGSIMEMTPITTPTQVSVERVGFLSRIRSLFRQPAIA